MVLTNQNRPTFKFFKIYQKHYVNQTYLLTYLQIFIVDKLRGIQYTYNHCDLIKVSMY